MTRSVRALAALTFFVSLGVAQQPVMRKTTVSGLPSASSSSGAQYIVTDAISPTDCSTGGSTQISICKSNGSTWSAQTIGTTGTVTGVTWSSLPSWLTGSIATSSTTPALTISATTGQTTHQVIGTSTGTSFGPISLAAADLPATIAYTGQANSFGAGNKQTVQASSSTAGFNFGGVTANPSSLASGDHWYRSDLKQLAYYDGSAVHYILDSSKLQGTDSSFLTSGTISGTTGATLCLDGNGGATTSGCSSGGTTTPGGSNTAVQYNSSSAFGGDATNFYYNSTSHALTVTGALNSAGITSSGTGNGSLTLNGGTSGSAQITVAAAAGTPNALVLPTSTASSGQVLQSNGASPQQLSWGTLAASNLSNGTTGSGSIVLATSPTLSTPSIGATPVTISLTNASSTGTTVNTLAKLTGAPSTAVSTATTDTSGAVGLVVSGAGTSGTAQIAIEGEASCVFDAATTAGDYVQISSTTAGNCHDAGSSFPTSGQVFGRVLSTNASAGTYLLKIGSGAVAPGVTSFNGRYGAVTPTTGDYSFSNLSGSVAASQLPNPSASTLGGVESYASVAHQWLNTISTSGVPSSSQPASTDLSDTANIVRTTAGATFGNYSYDFSGAAHVKPTLVGTAASKPATCAVGEMYFASDATAGQNFYYCTASNTWTQQIAGSGGTPAFGSITTGNNSSATMTVSGTGSIVPSGTGVVQANSLAAAATGETPASALGFACDGATDDSSHFNSSSTAGLTIHLPDNSKCLGSNLSFYSGARYVCTGCSIAKLPSDTTHYLVNLSTSNVYFKGVTFDLNAMNIGSYSGSGIATSAVTVSSGGSGFPASQYILLSFTGGSCSSEPSGYATVNSSGVVTTVTLWSPGGGCTSNPTINTTWTSGSACPSGGCTAPTFSYTTPANTSAPQNYYGLYFNNPTNIVMEDCNILSTGSSTSNLSQSIGGLLIYKGSGRIIRTNFQNTVAGGQLKHDSGATTGKWIFQDDNFDGSGTFALQVTSSNSTNPIANDEIAGGQCTNVYDALQGTSTGSYGNCYSIYNVANVDIHDTKSWYPRYSAIRVTGSRAHDNLIHHNFMNGAGEASMWAELGAENNTFSDNIVENFSTGMSATNLSQRPTTSRNKIVGNQFKGGTNFALYVDHDDVIGNTFVDVPIGMKVGFGGTGQNENIALNYFRSTNVTSSVTAFPQYPMVVALSVDKGLTGAGINLNGNQVEGTGVVTQLPVNNPQLNICGITAASPAVVTFCSAPSSPSLTVGQSWLITNVQTWQGNGSANTTNMTQINGLVCTASAVTSTTITCGGGTAINSSSFTAFAANPQGNSQPAAFLLYSTGTTPQWTWPSTVTYSNTLASTTQSNTPAYGDITALFGSGSCAGYTDSTGACSYGKLATGAGLAPTTSQQIALNTTANSASFGDGTTNHTLLDSVNGGSITVNTANTFSSSLAGQLNIYNSNNTTGAFSGIGFKGGSSGASSWNIGIANSGGLNGSFYLMNGSHSMYLDSSADGFFSGYVSGVRFIKSKYTNAAATGSITLDASLYSYYYLTLTGNTTLSAINYGLGTEEVIFVICQNSTGGYTFTWPTAVRGGMTISSTANSCSTQMLSTIDGTNYFGLGANTGL